MHAGVAGGQGGALGRLGGQHHHRRLARREVAAPELAREQGRVQGRRRMSHEDEVGNGLVEQHLRRGPVGGLEGDALAGGAQQRGEQGRRRAVVVQDQRLHLRLLGVHRPRAPTPGG